MLSTTSSVRPRPWINESSSCLPKCLALIEDSKMVIAKPTQMAEMKKRTGRMGEYQKGYSLFGRIRYKLPSEDWCNVESTTPAITRGMMMACCTCNAFVIRSEEH